MTSRTSRFRLSSPSRFGGGMLLGVTSVSLARFPDEQTGGAWRRTGRFLAASWIPSDPPILIAASACGSHFDQRPKAGRDLNPHSRFFSLESFRPS
jgi:hypothetical protein